MQRSTPATLVLSVDSGFPEVRLLIWGSLDPPILHSPQTPGVSSIIRFFRNLSLMLSDNLLSMMLSGDTGMGCSLVDHRDFAGRSVGPGLMEVSGDRAVQQAASEVPLPCCRNWIVAFPRLLSFPLQGHGLKQDAQRSQVVMKLTARIGGCLELVQFTKKGWPAWLLGCRLRPR